MRPKVGKSREFTIPWERAQKAAERKQKNNTKNYKSMEKNFCACYFVYILMKTYCRNLLFL